MKKNKKELEEENKQLKEVLGVYGDFWETDAIKDCLQERIIVRKAIKLISILLLMGAMLLIGMAM